MANKGDPINFSQEQAATIADDALKLFRINLIIIGLYASVLALLYRGNGSGFVIDIIESYYTIFGFLTWFGAMIGGVIHYRYGRRMAFSRHRHSRLSPPSNATDVAVNFISAVALGTLIALLSLVVGILDGASNTSIPLARLVLPVVVSVFPILFLFLLLYYWDRLKVRFPWIRWGFNDWARWLENSNK